MHQTTMRLIALAALLFASVAHACIFNYGERDSQNHTTPGDYNYAYNGADWINDFAICRGQRQSPILLPGSRSGLPRPAATTAFSYGSFNSALLTNNGHTLVITIPNDFQSRVTIPIFGNPQTASITSVLTESVSLTGVVTDLLSGSIGPSARVRARPINIHFHTHSEHVLAGYPAVLEMHIVHIVAKSDLPSCPDDGCIAVLGVQFTLTSNENDVRPALRNLIDAMPLNEDESVTVSQLVDVQSLLPDRKDYFTYEGSLTTPPCSEGLLWHVMQQPLRITESLLLKYKQAVAGTKCPHEQQAAAATAAAATNSLQPGAQSQFVFPPVDAEGCRKLGNGMNYRVTQPINSRPVLST